MEMFVDFEKMSDDMGKYVEMLMVVSGRDLDLVKGVLLEFLELKKAFAAENKEFFIDLVNRIGMGRDADVRRLINGL